MVSRRNYFIIAVVMGIVFFLFQFSTVAREFWNDYSRNPYVKEADQLPNKSDAYGVGEGGDAAERVIVYIGEANGSVENTVREWALYAKKTLRTYPSVAEFDAAIQGGNAQADNDAAEMVIVSPTGVSWDNASDIRRLQRCVDSGIDLVFCGLPDVNQVERNEALRSLLGIRRITAKSTTVAGMHLYDGFLLGGESVYKADDEEENGKRQDMELTLPWYRLTSGTQIYMKGIPVNESIKPEGFPPVIWQKSFGSASVFAVNGSYMEDVTGLGILSAMEAKTKDYAIYPVVNAQNLVIANYPGMAAENGSEMTRRYGRSMKYMMRDIIWPDLASNQYWNTLGLSCMMTPQFDYSDGKEPDPEMLIYYMKLLNEQNAEAGLSGINVSNTPIAQKLTADEQFMQETLPEYLFTSFYAGKMDENEVNAALKQDILKDVRTIVADYKEDSELLGYASETVTKQTATADGLAYTYSQDLRTRSLETALGYSSVLVDIMRAAYPEDTGNDTWAEISADLDLDLQYYWENFSAFSETTVSECDERIRNFLTVNYEDRREGNEIHLDVKNSHGTAWFILRTNDQAIQKIEGGDWEKVEKDVFLIQTDRDKVIITLKAADEFKYKYDSEEETE